MTKIIGTRNIPAEYLTVGQFIKVWIGNGKTCRPIDSWRTIKKITRHEKFIRVYVTGCRDYFSYANKELVIAGDV